MSKINWVFIFLPILILTAVSSLVSQLTTDFYSRDSAIIAIKCHYLDLIHLGIVVPIGIVMYLMAVKKSYWAKLFTLGIMAYLAFMFGFNALSLFFNKLFLIYVVLFSLNIFGIILGYRDVRQQGDFHENSLKIKISGAFLMLFALTAYYAWLSEIIAATLTGSIPVSIAGLNLPVNVVHVFDMAFALPMIIIGAILLFKGKMAGLIISSIMAAFVFFVCVSLLGMELALQYNNMPVDEGILYSAYVLTPMSIFPLIILFRTVWKLSGDKK
jgi:hypothetical protein